MHHAAAQAIVVFIPGLPNKQLAYSNVYCIIIKRMQQNMFRINLTPQQQLYLISAVPPDNLND